MNHLDRCQTDLDVTIVRADSPTTHIATITETQADGVRSYTLTLPDETTAGQDDAIGAAAYQAIRDRTHDLQEAAAPTGARRGSARPVDAGLPHRLQAHLAVQ